MKTKFTLVLLFALAITAGGQIPRVESDGTFGIPGHGYPSNFWSVNASNYVAELARRGIASNAASASVTGPLRSNDYATFAAKQDALGYNPATNSLAGITAAQGYQSVAPTESRTLSLSSLGNAISGNVGGTNAAVTNLYVGANLPLKLTTNVVVILGAGNTTNNMTHVWNSSLGCYTNKQYHSIVKFQNPTWYLVTQDAVNQYSITGATPFGSWNVVNGASSAPTSIPGYAAQLVGAEFVDDEGTIGIPLIALQVMPVTNGSSGITLTNGVFAGDGTAVTNVNAAQLGNHPATYFAAASSVASITQNGPKFEAALGAPIAFTNGIWVPQSTAVGGIGLGGISNTPFASFGGISGASTIDSYQVAILGCEIFDLANTNVVYADSASGGSSAKGFAYTNDGTGLKWVQADSANNIYSYYDTSAHLWFLTNAGSGTLIASNVSLTGVYYTGATRSVGVYFRPWQRDAVQSIYTQTNSVTVTNTASETAIFSIPSKPNYFQMGDTNIYPNMMYAGAKWQVSGNGTFSCVTGNSANLVVTLYLNSTTISTVTISSNAIPTNVVNQAFEFNMPISVQGVASGTATAVVGGGISYATTISSIPVRAFADASNGGAAFTFDATTRKGVMVTVQWTVNIAGNQVKINQAGITKLN